MILISEKGKPRAEFKKKRRNFFYERFFLYSLKDMSKPMGISEYKFGSVLPEELSKQLPSVEDIQKRIK